MDKTLNQHAGFFPDAAKYTLANGGGFLDDPDLGPVNYDISQQTLAVYRSKQVSFQDVQNLSAGEAVAIYHKLYWCPLSVEGITKLATSVALFDMAILYGIRAAVIMAQRALKDCDSVVISLDPKFIVDGYMGPITIDELNRCPERIFLSQFHFHVLRHLNDLCLKNPNISKKRRALIVRANKILTLPLTK